MFKAKLIENKKYYRLRSKQLVLMLLPSIPIGLIVNFYQIPIWVTVLMIGLYIVAIILMARNQKQITANLGNKIIEIDEEAIRIKSKKGVEDELISLNEVEKIILKDEYSMPQGTIREVGQELTGKTKQNYLIIYQDSRKRQLDFEVDSYFMVNQLNKLIEIWKMKGYNIERVNQK
ncbi:hypothetical protein [Flavilitoribacter nigricans]|uniref:Uncharacterized protein n=1 Tax=Flavilitoribacter nigricans (strain ATCC 23147 / DSM 23189 / NBRC 102662 / NCIMB 1420 / SS-2) TaxID=1122177 RepID=A0A2D0N0Q1_FLAN2|nr:hypothetical protein [Flavilitoribacter nigricans]PHN01293.1 hypothetical protein CRP01_38085 [Flavilitoribacter nigricans DSM 23189 = NBRC 102662]